MTDPLSLLRQYNIGSIEFTERDDQIIFGETSWPKNTKTTFRCKSKDSTVEYYTLECLVYYLKNYHMSHPAYCRQAKAANMQAVRRPDRKEILKYLYGQIDTCASIDTGAFIDKSAETKQLKRTRVEEEGESEDKKPRIDETCTERKDAKAK